MQFVVGAGILLMTAFSFAGTGEVKYEKMQPGQEPEFIKARDQMHGRNQPQPRPKNEAEGKVKDVEIDFANELEEGMKRVLKVGETDSDKVLIAKYNGKVYAVGNFCSHFGVPLEYGEMFDDKLLCPAHGAAFSVISGEPESAPALDGIPTFPVVEREGKFFVQIPEEGLPKKATQQLTARDPENKTHFVIIGGGAAGLNCAETLR